MLKMSKISSFVFVLFLANIFPNKVVSQITVTSDDILGLLGATQTMAIDTGSITVDVGSPGANQTWDFRSVATNDILVQDFLAPGLTPWASDFLQSNLVQKATWTPDSTIYGYFEINSTILSNVGIVLDINSQPIVLKCDNTTPTQLPFVFGSQWTSLLTCTDLSGTFTVLEITSDKTVDGWGIVRLATADLECLRICSRDTTIITIPPMSPDTTEVINYNWVTKNNYIVAAVTSQNGETNPNFTSASIFQRLKEMPNDVEYPLEIAEIPSKFELSQNFPNPFNPATTIRYGLPKQERVTLKIYNLLGGEVKTLVKDEMKASGYNTAIWDGRNNAGGVVAGGLYFVHMRAGEFVQTRKMILVK